VTTKTRSNHSVKRFVAPLLVVWLVLVLWLVSFEAGYGAGAGLALATALFGVFLPPSVLVGRWLARRYDVRPMASLRSLVAPTSVGDPDRPRWWAEVGPTLRRLRTIREHVTPAKTEVGTDRPLPGLDPL
jgi:hypothetical protein